MIYLRLLISFLKIGFFGFGGGYAMLSLIQDEIVMYRGWLTSEEMSDIIAISQITPGPVAINCATYVGYTVSGGVWGALLATTAVCVPALTVMLAITKFYLHLRGNRYLQGAMEGIRPMVAGMILSAAILLLRGGSMIDPASWIIMAVVLLLSLKKINPILLIVLSGVAGLLIYGV